VHLISQRHQIEVHPKQEEAKALLRRILEINENPCRNLNLL